ncbi:MAG: sigma-54 dependent transcriptional regulator [Pirellulales bacterium]
MSKWLIVDDEPSICWGLSQLGERTGHSVSAVSSAEQALQIPDAEAPDVIVLDVRLPGMSGLQAIEKLRAKWGAVPVIVITAYGDLQTAVEAVRNGAFDYVLKPFDLAQVQRSLERALRPRESAAVPTSDVATETELVGVSNAMRTVFHRIALAASADACVLLTGESGTGKELAARAIHRYSERGRGPLVAVNIAALNPSLVESELFGHVRGAFTGAATDHTGLLVRASGGTLFLDEVADIPLQTQVKLLRVLEDGIVVPVGGVQGVPTNFRLITATHQDLNSCVREGKFRHDLYFRLAAFRIEMPALRHRPEDIPVLVEHLLRQSTATSGRAMPSLSAAAIAELSRRPWYGNVRELRNAIEHAAIFARHGLIEPDHLPAQAEPALVGAGSAPQSAETANLGQQITAWVERRLRDDPASDESDGHLYEEFLSITEPPMLSAVMTHFGGQYAAAARRLGLHRTTVRKKLDQYHLAVDRSAPGESLE